MKEKAGFSTRLIHHPGGTCAETGAVSPPIYQVSTFRQSQEGQRYDYSRSGNPTRDVLEAYIADLEGARKGFAFSSGMAAISAAVMLLRGGDHLIATEGLYGGSYRALTRVFNDYGISYSFTDTSSIDRIQEAFRENTRALLVETPSNPLMQIADLGAVASLARENQAALIVDNTFMSPLLQRPLELGADVVVHSATKFLGGHSDLILGLAATSDERIAERLGHLQNSIGAVPSPLDCWLLIRGMKTLAVRLERSQSSAGELAGWLLSRPEVSDVFYPGLPTSPNFSIHQTQALGAGAILSFRLTKNVDAGAFLGALEIWTPAVSLGAVESIITQPACMTHLTYPEEERERLGIDRQLIRLSVGIEAVADLIEDLARALDRARS